jgi:mono/diheme cytochrome c family protein
MFIKILSAFSIAVGIISFSPSQDTLKESMKRGEDIYLSNCASCHMQQGEGLEGVYPPLAKTAYLKNQKRAIGIILNGQEGEINVNGKTYNTPMAPFGHFTDQQVADVLNYISNNWGNKYPQVKPAHVKALRK